VIRGGKTLIALATIATAALLPGASASAATGPPTLDLNGPKSPGLLDKVTAVGSLPGATGGENVTVQVDASGNAVEKKQLTVGADGKFSFPFVIDSCCNYQVTATSGGQSSQPQRFTVRVPKHLGKGAIAHLYNQSLVDEGYYTGGHVSGKYNHGSQLATLAFRKVNNMGRNYQYKPVIFEKLLQEGRLPAPLPLGPPRRGGHLPAGDGVGQRRQRGLRLPRLHRQALHPDGAGHLPLLSQGPWLQLGGDVLLRVLHPGLRDSRLQPRADARGGEPRLHQESDPVLALHLQLDQPRRRHSHLPLAGTPRSLHILGP
jgi:hypothetical protein